MPIHDWTRVDAALFHSFHQRWISSLCDALNGGVLPSEYFALADQPISGLIPDVLTLRLGSGLDDGQDTGSAGLAVAATPPRARLVQQAESQLLLQKADRIAVRHRHGQIIAVLEIVSPGNKASRAELRTFVEKSCSVICQGVHLLIIDLFPPGKRDPQGIHKAIWDEIEEQPLDLPAEKPLTLVSYSAGWPKRAYVESVAVGDVLPDMPLFLTAERYVPVPLETTYETTWAVFPAAMKRLLE